MTSYSSSSSSEPMDIEKEDSSHFLGDARTSTSSVEKSPSPNYRNDVHPPTTMIRDKAEALRLYSEYQDPWHYLDPVLRQDRDVAVAALLTGHPVDELPEEILTDRDFWISKVQQGDASWWLRLPQHFQVCPEFVSDINKIAHPRTAKAILCCHPHLQSDIGFWKTVVESGLATADFLAEMASPHLLHNKPFMLEAVSRDYRLFGCLSRTPLCRDRDLVEAALKQSIRALMYIPATVQLRYADLVVAAIARSDGQPRDWMNYLAGDLWSDRRVALAWAEIGGEYLEEQFPANFSEDQELLLQFAVNNGSQFRHASERLRSDKPFMTQAVETNGSVILYSHGDLRKDFDLALVAFANTEDLVDRFIDTCPGNLQYLNGFARHVEEQLIEHSNFQLFLCGMSTTTHRSSSSGNNLVMLNQGPETTTMYNQQFAEYIGVPTGKKLGQLRSAKRNLSREKRNDFSELLYWCPYGQEAWTPAKCQQDPVATKEE